MTVESMALVMNHSRSKANARLVLIGIANHDGDGGSWPKIETLAKYANVSERTVQRMIDELVELGEVTVHYNEGGTHHTRNDQRTNLYVINLACPPECDGTTKHKPRGDNSVTPSGVRGDSPVRNGATAVSPEPSFNHPSPTGEGSLGTDRSNQPSLDPTQISAGSSLRSSRVPDNGGCSRHPNGTDQPCPGCARARERAEVRSRADEQKAREAQQEQLRQEAAQRRRNAAKPETRAAAAARIRAEIADANRNRQGVSA